MDIQPRNTGYTAKEYRIYSQGIQGIQPRNTGYRYSLGIQDIQPRNTVYTG